jgi:cell wall-associated NlpC family hydrolase
VAQNATGRHRAPGRYNPLAELKVIAKESAQPAVKGAAIVAASGGIIATVANPASASDSKPPVVAADAVVNAAAASAPAAVGPEAAVTEASNALTTIGFKPAAAPKAKPIVIEDLVAKQQQEAAAKAEEARQQAAAERAAAQRAAASQAASRSSDRMALTSGSAPAPQASDPAPSASGIVGIAQSMFGVPYAYGGSSPSGFDCSGFTSWVYRQAGISIPRTASAQQSAAAHVSSPQPGDLVFFGYPAYHVGIYVSPGRMIDAQRPGTTVGNHSIWTTPSGYGRF